MSEQDGRRIGALLAGAVPELPDPPDRLDAVAGRVHRARRRVAVLGTTVAVVAVIAGAIALPDRRPTQAVPDVTTSLSALPVAVAPSECPAPDPLLRGEPPLPELEAPSDPFVPPDPDRVVLCGYLPAIPSPPSDVIATFRPLEPVLLADPAGFAATLDELPPLRQDAGCLAALTGYYVAVLHYPDGSTVEVRFDRNCAAAIAGTQARGAGSVIPRLTDLLQDE